jgi:hypothetical protein
MTRVGAAEKAATERLGLRVFDASEAGWGITPRFVPFECGAAGRYAARLMPRELGFADVIA